MWLWQETLLQKFVKFGVNLTFFAPWLPWQWLPFWICSTPKDVTHYGAYFYKVSWSLMNGIQKCFNSPLLFCFHGNCGKVHPTDSVFLAYLAPLDVDVVSYQVSSISVWQVTCYDNFCVFRIFRIFDISMAMAAILNLFNPKSCHTLQWIFLQSFMKFDEKNEKKIKSPLFCFHGNCGSLSNRFRFFWLISFH